MKLYWNWAFAWEAPRGRSAKGQAIISLSPASRRRNAGRSIASCSRPTRTIGRSSRSARHRRAVALEDIRRGNGQAGAARRAVHQRAGRVEAATFRDKGFLYLWNMNAQVSGPATIRRRAGPVQRRRRGDAQGVRENVRGQEGRADLRRPADRAGFRRRAVSFSNPTRRTASRIPGGGRSSSGSTPIPIATGGYDELPPGQADLGRGEGELPEVPRSLRRLVAGESLGYFYVKPETMKAATARQDTPRTRRGVHEPRSPRTRRSTRTVYGQDWPDAYREVIPCQSIGMTAFAPLCYSWGARTVGYESSAITSGCWRCGWRSCAARPGSTAA